MANFLDFLDPIGSFASAGLGGIFGMINTSNTNEQNAKIAQANINMQKHALDVNRLNVRETNAQNLQLAREYNRNMLELQREQNSFNEYQMNKTNEYNSPKAQLERAKQAGINPNAVIGAPIAAQPVQQNSLPDQQLGHVDSYEEKPIYNNMRYESTGLEKLGEALGKMARYPFLREQLESMKEDNKNKRLQNDVLEYDKWQRDQEKKRFENFGFVVSKSGRKVTPDEYSRLSDEDKKDFLDPLYYKNKISDRTLSLDDFKVNVPDSEKDKWFPIYGDLSSRLPTIEKSVFHSRQDYENYSSLYAFGNTLTNIEADHLQNEIRKKVYSGQLYHNEITNAMIYMPDQVFKNLVQDGLKVKAQVDAQLEENVGLAKRLKDQDRITEYTANRMQNEASTNAINIIKQYVPDGKLQSFFISLYAIIREIHSFTK